MGQIVSFEGYTPPARFDAVAWSVAKIQEATTADGPWTLIETITLTPADSDPADPQERSFTTDQGTAPGLWYRVVFADGSGNQANPTVPVHNDDSGPPALFATADDLAARIGLDLTAGERVRANQLLERVSALIQGEAKQTIALVEDDELTMPGTNADRIMLPQRPVLSVSSVTLGGSALVEGTDWFLDGNQIVRLASTFVQGMNVSLDEPYLLGSGTGFGRPSQELVIVYTHGYAANEIPEVCRTIALEAVVRVWVNPGSVARETVGDTSTVYDNMRFSPAGLLLTDDERRALRSFFGRRAISVTIGG